MPHLVLVNGAPGSGKSTVAAELVRRRPMALALDVDTLKHGLGGWDDDTHHSGLRARELALAAAEVQLRAGDDVVLGQFCARPEFPDQLTGLAARFGVDHAEFVLELTPEVLRSRLLDRHQSPNRPEHWVNRGLVDPEEAAALLDSVTRLADQRPEAVRIDASGTLAQTVDRIARHLGWT